MAGIPFLIFIFFKVFSPANLKAWFSVLVLIKWAYDGRTRNCQNLQHEPGKLPVKIRPKVIIIIIIIV